MIAVSMFQEKRREWQRSLWFAALDFKKAFGRVQPSCLRRALARQEVSSLWVDCFTLEASITQGKQAEHARII
eukprot:6160441-Pyramimonas_sp.AAC.1